MLFRSRYKNKYELVWDQKSPKGYLGIMAVLQKFIDQAISVNTSYNPKHYDNNELPMSELLKDLVYHYSMGGKTLYYFNTNDQSSDEEEEPTSNNHGVIFEDDCDSCKI